MTTTAVSFKKIVFVCVMMIACLFSFTACTTNTAFTENPSASDIVEGNGTLAVTYGDYVYYTNGFTGYEDVKDTNKEGNITYSGLYRTKLVNGQAVETETDVDDEGKVIFDETKSINDTDILVSKVCGFEYMGLYIFGDYIYYTTPNNLKGGDLSVRTDLIDFCRTKLDRSSGQELLYTTTNSGSAVTYNMYEKDGVVYQIIMDGRSSSDTSKMVVNTIKNTGISTFTTDSDWKVTSYAETKYTTSAETVNDLDKDLYFTYQTDDITTYTVLAKLELGTTNVTTILNDNSSTIVLEGSRGGRLYYTKSTINPASEGAYLFYNNMNTADFFAGEGQLTTNAYTNYIVYNSGIGVGALVYDSSNTSVYRVTASGNPVQVLSGTSITNFIGIYGNYFYYLSSSNIYRVNFVTLGTAENLTSDDGTISASEANYVSIAGDKMFYLKQYSNDDNTAYYVHMKNFSIVDADTNAYYDHFVGKLAEIDYVTEDTTE